LGLDRGWAYEAQLFDTSEEGRVQLEGRKCHNFFRFLGAQQAGRNIRLDKLAHGLQRVMAPGTEGSRLGSRNAEGSGRGE
jgi:hypothetical protein